jgi:hypothetical protein
MMTNAAVRAEVKRRLVHTLCRQHNLAGLIRMLRASQPFVRRLLDQCFCASDKTAGGWRGSCRLG